jgi:hypothetical protein
VGAEWGQMVAWWVQHGFYWCHGVGLGSRLRGSRIGCSAEQTNEGQACIGSGRCAGGDCGRGRAAGCARVRVKGRILRPEGDSGAVSSVPPKNGAPGLTGWQTDILVVCNGRALSLRGHSARDPATADAEECALAAGRGAASVSAAAVSE